ncbi:MAG: hypothetical protein LLG21_05360, partial [Euryarchaeota archaeon]|nr:hypothetical protein [Euryarchaeota archaeon]
PIMPEASMVGFSISTPARTTFRDVIAQRMPSGDINLAPPRHRDAVATRPSIGVAAAVKAITRSALVLRPSSPSDLVGPLA